MTPRHALLLLPVLLAAGCNDGAFASLNSPPGASILEPEHGTEIREGETVRLRGFVDDNRTPLDRLLVSWTSSLDGQLFEGQPGDDAITSLEVTTLQPGEHDISLRVVDPRGLSGTDQVTITVLENGAPSIVITEPLPDGVYHSDVPVPLVVGVIDPEDDPTDLRVNWTHDGAPLVSEQIPDSGGTSIATVEMEEGNYSLIAEVRDQEGKTATATVTFVVGGPNGLPSCSLDAPGDGSVFIQGDAVTFSGTATDPDVPASALSIDWLSSADGALGSSVAADSGAVAFSTSSLSGGLHTVTMVVVDEVGATCADSVDIRISSPPSVVISSPAPASTVGEGVGVLIEGTVLDLEDPEESLYVEWSSSLEAIGPDYPDSNGFVTGLWTPTQLGSHVLTLSATDTEGLTGTATVTLDVNGAPGAPVVSIAPTTPTSLDDLVAQIDVSASDPEADPLTYTWTWLKDGVPQSGLTGATVPASNTIRSQVWTVSVSATDGWNTGPAGTASVTIANGAPTVTAPTISPSALYTTTTPTCGGAIGSDPDGDPVTVSLSWEVNGAAVATGATLSSSAIAKNDTVVCVATPTDGIDVGASVPSTALSVLNSAPSAPVPSISPSNPTPDDALTCDLTAAGVDPDGDSVTHDTTWEINGTALSGSGTLLGAVWTNNNDTVTCSVTATDGSATSPAGTDTVTVCAQGTWYEDFDGDGYGNYATEVVTCSPPAGWIAVAGDCDDTDATIYPTAGDTATDNVDSDCDGMECEAADLNGTYFVVCLDNGDWFDAELACTSAGYDGLASLTSAAEETHVVNLLIATGGANNQHPWIGLTDQGLPGTFAWTDGSPLSYTNWDTGQPDSGGSGNDCAVLDYSSGASAWDDVSCSQGSPGWTAFACSTR